jgi:hypothetical protein
MNIKNDATEQNYILNIIDNQLTIINELSIDLNLNSNCRNSLIEFRDSVDKNWSFDNQNYLNIVKINCQALLNDLSNNKVIEFLLNFSKISCEVKDVYLETGLKPYISSFLAENTFETNDYNQVLVNDFLFDYYYNLAKDKFKSEGLDGLSGFIKTVPVHRKEFVDMILHSFKNSLIINLEEFAKLKSQLTV